MTTATAIATSVLFSICLPTSIKKIEFSLALRKRECVCVCLSVCCTTPITVHVDPFQFWRHSIFGFSCVAHSNSHCKVNSTLSFSFTLVRSHFIYWKLNRNIEISKPGCHKFRITRNSHTGRDSIAEMSQTVEKASKKQKKTKADAFETIKYTSSACIPVYQID